MSKEYFKFSTAILSRLGEELNPNIDQGILELVKNSYDADASMCSVELSNTQSEGGLICIEDDGNGMDRNAIINGWLVLGKSSKKSNERTAKDRLPVGNKGLGRLASLRLGTKATIETVSINNTKKIFKLSLDWEKFDSVEVVESVPLDLEEISNSENRSKGTRIIIENLRNEIPRKDVHSLARSLILLSDPFDDTSGFKPTLKAKEFHDLEELVNKSYFDEAEFVLEANINKGKSRAVVKDYKGKILYKASHKDLELNDRLYECPDAEFKLWVYILNKESFSSRSVTIGEVKDWLSQVGGVHLYHRGIRVHPYGDPGFDWLDMNLSRVKSPELRPSTNTSIGRIIIEDSRQILMQKTDRSGFVESLEFKEIKRFSKDVMNWMARKRLQEREDKKSKEKRKAPIASEKAKNKLQELLSEFPKKDRTKIESAITRYDEAKEREERILREELQLYRTLSTVGTTSATFAHESQAGLTIIKKSSEVIQRRGQKFLKKKYATTIKDAVERIISQVDSLAAFSKTALGILDRSKRRRMLVGLNATIEKLLKKFHPFFEDRAIHIEKKLSNETPSIFATEAAVEAIVLNLIINSIQAFERSTLRTGRLIKVVTNVKENAIQLKVSDNGPGIVGISKNDIWLPGQTTTANGTGLGLTIVKDAVEDLGGAVEVLSHGELRGAEFILTIPIVEKI